MKIFSRIGFLCLLLCGSNAFAQLVINDGAIMRIAGGTAGTNCYLVMEKPSVCTGSPITMMGTGPQGIYLEENQYNRVSYRVKATTKAVTVPYLTWNNEYIPLNFNLTSAG